MKTTVLTKAIDWNTIDKLEHNIEADQDPEKILDRSSGSLGNNQAIDWSTIDKLEHNIEADQDPEKILDRSSGNRSNKKDKDCSSTNRLENVIQADQNNRISQGGFRRIDDMFRRLLRVIIDCYIEVNK